MVLVQVELDLNESNKVRLIGRQGPGRFPRTPINENGAWIDASQAGNFSHFLIIFLNFI